METKTAPRVRSFPLLIPVPGEKRGKRSGFRLGQMEKLRDIQQLAANQTGVICGDNREIYWPEQGLYLAEQGINSPHARIRSTRDKTVQGKAVSRHDA